jgi:hypothetical protein
VRGKKNKTKRLSNETQIETLKVNAEKELRISDVIARLLQKAELIYGKDEDVTYFVIFS